MNLANFLHHMKFLKKKPRILPRIIKDLFYVRVLGKPRLRTVDFAITYKCNGNCPMCSAHELMKIKGEELSVSEIVSIMRQAIKLGAIHINLTGGEPTMRSLRDIERIVDGVNELGLLVSIVTNSITINNAILLDLTLGGLDTIQLSLESMDAKTHDRIRGMKGNYKKLMQVFRWAKDLGLNICLSTVITNENFSEIKKIIAFGKKEKVFVLLNPISGYPSLSIKNKLPEYYKLLKQGHVRADTIVNWRGGSGCPGGIERIYITPYGDVHTCPHIHKSYGNLRQESLATIYKRICKSPLKEFKKHCRHITEEVK